MMVDVALEGLLRVESTEAFADDTFKSVGAGVSDVMPFQPIERRSRSIKHFAAYPTTMERFRRRR